MAHIKKREEAIVLRKKAESIGFIAKKLSVSKSTVSMWCKDIVLSPTQILKIAEKSKHHATLALLQSSETKRIARLELIQRAARDGKNDIRTLTQRDILMVGLGLYWGEGYKKGNQELGFTNSDPAMVLFYIFWLKSVYGVKSEDLILRISINIFHKNRVRVIENFWSRKTGIPLNQFTKCSLVKSKTKKVYTNVNQHYGTLRIKVRRGTQLRRRILGSVEALALLVPAKSI